MVSNRKKEGRASGVGHLVVCFRGMPVRRGLRQRAGLPYFKSIEGQRASGNAHSLSLELRVCLIVYGETMIYLRQFSGSGSGSGP